MTSQQRVERMMDGLYHDSTGQAINAQLAAESDGMDEWFTFAAALEISAIRADAIWVYCQSMYGTN